MNRRELLKGVAAIIATASASQALAAEADHTGMHHDHEHKANKYQKLLDSASDCVLKAQVCLQHCLVKMGQGEKELAACAQSASLVITICGTLQQLAVADSKHLTQMAKLAMDICKDCEDECKKTDKHPECKACGEACVACYKECKAIAI